MSNGKEENMNDFEYEEITKKHDELLRRAELKAKMTKDWFEKFTDGLEIPGTETQKHTIRRIIRQFPDLFFYDHYDKYEVKKFELVENEHGTISLYVQAGMIGDEGTYAAILARDTLHIFIGKRGGITYVNDNCKVKRVKEEYIFQVVEH